VNIAESIMLGMVIIGVTIYGSYRSGIDTRMWTLMYHSLVLTFLDLIFRSSLPEALTLTGSVDELMEFIAISTEIRPGITGRLI
jgi:hypothetical protein